MANGNAVAYRDAISLALAEEMRRDPTVLVIGEDVGEAGGPLKTTSGLFDEFGPSRVRDTPISENGFVGAALGLAITGYRPVIEIMFSDFLGVCFDQIANSIAKHRFMSGGHQTVPLVLRVIGGGGLRFGPQHSQTGETWLLPVPGLKIVSASDSAEAYGMLKAAIRDDNPVLLFEHKALLGISGEVAVGIDKIASLDGPAIRRAGTDVTIVASLGMVRQALAAAEQLATSGISAEIIDLRVLRPFNPDVILQSVARTSRLVTVEEQTALGGWGAEVVAAVACNALEYLDAAPRRLALPDQPTPYSPPLEDFAIPDADRIVATVLSMLKG